MAEMIQKTFRERVIEGWQSFLSQEAVLRKMMDEKQESGQLIEKCQELLSPVFCDICFELGYNGEKYELILTPEESRAKLFPLLYFQQRVPAEVSKYWNVLVGRQQGAAYSLNMFGQNINGEEVLVWVKCQDEKISLSVYCEKLVPVLKENEDNAYWLFDILLNQMLGEIVVMKYVCGVKILKKPLGKLLGGAAVSLNQLSDYLQKEFSLEKDEMLDAAKYCDSYTAYQMKPNQAEDAKLRTDVFAGVTRCVPFIHEYLQGENNIINAYEQDGIVAGYFYYPLDRFTGENKGEQVLDFRDKIEAELSEKVGEDCFSFIGGASGIYYGYLDFIAWDIHRVLAAAADIFAKEDISWACFQSFRRDAKCVVLKEG